MKTDYTDDEILANRKKIIAYLRKPGLHKAQGVLRGRGRARCCLGHMCDVMGVASVFDDVNEQWKYEGDAYSLPDSIKDALGMFSHSGHFKVVKEYPDYFRLDDANHWFRKNPYSSLVALNDDSNIRPSEIADILEPMILGGSQTPWRRIFADGKGCKPSI
jgi:hypothetical protein